MSIQQSCMPGETDPLIKTERPVAKPGHASQSVALDLSVALPQFSSGRGGSQEGFKRDFDEPRKSDTGP